MASLDEPAARIWVEFLDVTTEDDEILVRSVHESLRECDTVHVVEERLDGRLIWVIYSWDASKIHHTHAGGREIHVVPRFEMPTLSLVYSLNFRPRPLKKTINCREFLTQSDLEALQTYFPGSVGVRVLIAGWVVILFNDMSTMETCWKLGNVEEIGLHRVGYDLAEYNTTADIVKTGHGVTAKPDEFNSHASLGLRLRLPCGTEAITTVTHAFVKTASPTMSSMRRRVSEWILTARATLLSLRPIPRRPIIPAVVETRAHHGNSPIGKAVWLAGTSTKVCTPSIREEKIASTNLDLDWKHHHNVR